MGRDAPAPRRTWLTFSYILAVNFLLSVPLSGRRAAVKVPYTLFKQEVTKGNVERIYSRGASLTGRFRAPVTYPSTTDTAAATKPRTGTTFATTLPAFVDPGLEALLIANGVEISAEPIAGAGNPILTFFGFGPALLLILFYVWLYRRAAKQGAGMGGLLSGPRKAARDASIRPRAARCRSTTSPESTRRRIALEIVDFLRDPQKYTRLGGTGPR